MLRYSNILTDSYSFGISTADFNQSQIHVSSHMPRDRNILIKNTVFLSSSLFLAAAATCLFEQRQNTSVCHINKLQSIIFAQLFGSSLSVLFVMENVNAGYVQYIFQRKLHLKLVHTFFHFHAIFTEHGVEYVFPRCSISCRSIHLLFVVFVFNSFKPIWKRFNSTVNYAIVPLHFHFLHSFNINRTCKLDFE